MEYVIAANFFLFALLSVAWSSKDWLNILVKYAFVCMMVFNGVATFQQFGYILKV